MRMRKKKHLEDRLDACKDLMIKIDSDVRDLNDINKIEAKFNKEQIFGNSNPVYLEIGCGKGQFVCESAKQNSDINYIAIEKTANVIVAATEKAIDMQLNNIRFISIPVEYLENYFEDKSIDRIYLNFSCPYPKNRYAKHRLTHENFLRIYRKILAKDAEIHLKTDNMHFFEYTIESLSAFGFKIKNVSLDLHNSDFEGNIVTEYEKRFSDMGCPIYRLEAF